MYRQLHFTPAIAAIAFVLCLAGFAFLVVAMLPSPFGQPFVQPDSVGRGVLHLGKAAGFVILLGYSAGIAGWLATFWLRCDGMHRLSSVLEHQKLK